MYKKFKSIDGLRAFLAIGIVIMHIQSNTDYHIDNYIWNNIIPLFANFVYLFMVITGFSICCGYYEKIKKGEIALNEFYKRRFAKILPFFTVVVLIELLYNRDLTSTIEGFTNLTLSYGLLPNNEISVIGVGWFLGITFLFYMIFPYFVFLLNDKKRGWFVLIISLLLNFACSEYFFLPKFVTENFTNGHNFLYDFIYFVIGGIIYLYKDEIIKIVSNKRYLFLLICIMCSILYIILSMNNNIIFTLKAIILFSIWMIYAISVEGKILNNKFTHFISRISMEIYLSHMIIFRLIEKLNLIHLFNVDFLDYTIVCIITIIGTVCFSICINKFLKICSNVYIKKIKEQPNI